MNIFNPDFGYLTRAEEEREDLFDIPLESGKRLVVKQSMKYDKANQINRVKWYPYIDGEEFVEKLDMRCFFPQEMDSILQYNGFQIISKYGDFDKNAFGNESSKQIFICSVR